MFSPLLLNQRVSETPPTVSETWNEGCFLDPGSEGDPGSPEEAGALGVHHTVGWFMCMRFRALFGLVMDGLIMDSMDFLFHGILRKRGNRNRRLRPPLSEPMRSGTTGTEVDFSNVLKGGSASLSHNRKKSNQTFLQMDSFRVNCNWPDGEWNKHRTLNTGCMWASWVMCSWALIHSGPPPGTMVISLVLMPENFHLYTSAL